MRFKELTAEEQAKVRRLLLDELRSTDSQPFPVLRKILKGQNAIQAIDPSALEEVDRLWRRLEEALMSDFELSAGMESYVKRDREAYLAIDQEFGHLPDTSDPKLLVRRIHHQRLELRHLERLLEYHWAWRAVERDQWEEWRKRQEALTDEPDDDVRGCAVLRSRLRSQRQALRHAERLIDVQREELSRLLHHCVKTAAAG